MILRLLLLSLLLAPGVNVNWSPGQSVTVQVQGLKDEIAACTQNGLEARLRFDVQVCSRRSLWLDHCSETHKARHGLLFDPITETYQLNFDRLYDQEGPRAISETSLDRAVEKLSVLREVAVSELDQQWEGRRRPYLHVRVRSDCKGEYNETIDRISSFVTLGLISMSGYDSGWQSFDLEKSQP